MNRLSEIYCTFFNLVVIGKRQNVSQSNVWIYDHQIIRFRDEVSNTVNSEIKFRFLGLTSLLQG